MVDGDAWRALTRILICDIPLCYDSITYKTCISQNTNIFRQQICCLNVDVLTDTNSVNYIKKNIKKIVLHVFYTAHTQQLKKFVLPVFNIAHVPQFKKIFEMCFTFYTAHIQKFKK
jgi:hypothetical protein